MGYCDYEVREKRSAWNGTYCSILCGYVHDGSIVSNYCNNSVRCVYCPHRDGDDRDRKPKEEPVRHQESYDTGYSSSSSSGYSSGTSSTPSYSGGGGGGGCCLGEIFGIFKVLVLICIAAVVITGCNQVLNLLGISGTRVYMQLPDGINPKTVTMYAVNQEENKLFKVRDAKFDKEGQCKLVTNSGHSDVYLEQDGASVWLGTCDLYLGNACYVEDISYEEAVEQMIRPVIIRLHNTGGTILSGITLQAADAKANPLPCVELDTGLYAVLLPNNTAPQALVFSAEGYLPVAVEVNTQHRLSMIAVTLAAEE